MDTTWPFNCDCLGVPKHIPSYYDKLVIPSIFYNAVIHRNINQVNMVIKYNPKLCVSILIFYDITLKSAFFFKKNAKFEMPTKIRWTTNEENGKIILNPNEQAELYNYITTAPWKSTNMGFLINAINNYLVQLRYVMGLINNRIPVNNYFYLGVNVHNNPEMKNYIAQFIPGYKG
jgi:hypothetical protein